MIFFLPKFLLQQQHNSSLQKEDGSISRVNGRCRSNVVAVYFIGNCSCVSNIPGIVENLNIAIKKLVMERRQISAKDFYALIGWFF